jgi:hypothetical protein
MQVLLHLPDAATMEGVKLVVLACGIARAQQPAPRKTTKFATTWGVMAARSKPTSDFLAKPVSKVPQHAPLHLICCPLFTLRPPSTLFMIQEATTEALQHAPITCEHRRFGPWALPAGLPCEAPNDGCGPLYEPQNLGPKK